MVVHNQSKVNQVVTAELESPGIDTLSSSQKVTIAPGLSETVYWDSQVSSPETEVLPITLSATGTDSFSDSISVDIPVLSYYTTEHTATAGEAADAASENIFLPDNIVADRGDLELLLSPSLGSGVVQALNHLIYDQYPTNVTSARKVLALSHMVAFAKQAELETLGVHNVDKLEKMIEQELQKLIRYQQPNGGWSWTSHHWEASAYATNSVVQALVAATEYGYTVDYGILSKAEEFLEEEFATQSLDEQAFQLQVLAQISRVKESDISRLMDRRWELSVYSRINLLRAMQLSNYSGRDRSQLKNELLAQVHKTNNLSHWESEGRSWYTNTNAVMTTALMLEVLVEDSVKDKLIPEIVRWFMDAREGEVHWCCQWTSAMASNAIIESMLASKQGKIDYSWQVSLANLEKSEGSFAKGDLWKNEDLSFAVADLPKEQELRLDVQKSGEGNLYYSMDLEYQIPFDEVDSVERGIVVVRELVDKDGIVIEDAVNRKDDVWVRLTLVTPSIRHHVVVEDPLPAGFEPVNNSLATTGLLSVEKLEKQEGVSDFYFKHTEMRDDKVILFAETMPPGVYEYTYRVRPTVPGVYHYPPANAENTNHPDIFGHSDGGWLTVLE